MENNNTHHEKKLTREQIKERLAKATDLLDGRDGELTPYEQCVVAHVGQCGECGSDGSWTGC